MKKNNKGFTLVELLAVIVILGLLMAIAIPSVTKYITQSRVKTLTSTMDSYITAVITQVNDGEYKFSDSTKIFAIPVECIALEKGGQSPFGNWLQANDAYWAYVLVHYDSENYNYQYGFTFKDDAGYGMYPTINDKIENSKVRTGYEDLKMPKNGLAIDFVSLDDWEGFYINANTELVVLESESEGVNGNGKTTCTLCKKGDNYEAIENKKKTRPRGKLNDLIKTDNTIIKDIPTLTTSINKTSDKSGLYTSTATTNGQPTYYFRGEVTNNYVEFANMMWKIIRINEDGTIRIILDNKINETNYTFNSAAGDYSNMYYSNSDAKTIVESWYNDKLKNYDSYIVNKNFCEEARVTYNSHWLGGNANLVLSKNYTPNFKCDIDGNNKGYVSSKVGLITYDEAVFAGAYYGNSNTSCYLYTGNYDIWTMTPVGKNATGAGVWFIKSTGALYDTYVTKSRGISPVINLNSNTKVKGFGTYDNPYVVVVE